MKIIKMILGIVIVGLILLGIVYNLIVPFTPIWFDLIVGGLIVVAFLIAHIISRKQNDATSKEQTTIKN